MTYDIVAQKTQKKIATTGYIGQLKRLHWDDGTYQDVDGRRHRCWISPEWIHGLKIYILDTRTLTAPIMMSGHTFDINLVPKEEREAKAFMVINGTSTRPKIEGQISLHPTRGEAQERAERLYEKSVYALFETETQKRSSDEGAGIKGVVKRFLNALR